MAAADKEAAVLWAASYQWLFVIGITGLGGVSWHSSDTLQMVM